MLRSGGMIICKQSLWRGLNFKINFFWVCFTALTKSEYHEFNILIFVNSCIALACRFVEKLSCFFAFPVYTLEPKVNLKSLFSVHYT